VKKAVRGGFFEKHRKRIRTYAAQRPGKGGFSVTAPMFLVSEGGRGGQPAAAIAGEEKVGYFTTKPEVLRRGDLRFSSDRYGTGAGEGEKVRKRTKANFS